MIDSIYTFIFPIKKICIVFNILIGPVWKFKVWHALPMRIGQHHGAICQTLPAAFRRQGPRIRQAGRRLWSSLAVRCGEGLVTANRTDDSKSPKGHYCLLSRHATALINAASRPCSTTSQSANAPAYRPRRGWPPVTPHCR